MKIADYLSVGHENAISSEALQKVTGLSKRELMRRIEKERKQGTVICCGYDGQGYYLPSSTVEILNFYRTTRKKAISTLASLKSARITLLKCYDGQLVMDDLKADEKFFEMLEDEYNVSGKGAN